MTKFNAQKTTAYKVIQTPQQVLGIYAGETSEEAWADYISQESDTPEPEPYITFGDCVTVDFDESLWAELEMGTRRLVCDGYLVDPDDEYDTILYPGISKLEIATTEHELAYI